MFFKCVVILIANIYIKRFFSFSISHFSSGMSFKSAFFIKPFLVYNICLTASTLFHFSF